jgi:hypothetical protein
MSSGDRQATVSVTVAPAAAPPRMITVRAAALATVNVASSVLIVLCNKVLFKGYDFNYPLTLSLVHFLFTIAGVELCRHFGLVKAAPYSLRAVLPISLAYVGFVVLTNIRQPQPLKQLQPKLTSKPQL